MKNLKKQFIELLNIYATSGNEKPVRKYLQKVLVDKVDRMTVDNYGNLLATKKIGNGEGATVLLSAHMDTVRGVFPDRKVVENNDVITSNKGALGADDRGGIAIILSVLRNIEKTAFNGTIKLAFSREEEIGCIGSGRIDKDWYLDVDLAIVVDRRGNRDIVVGNYGMAFCSDAVGYFMEDVAGLVGQDWKACEGGISDAMTFAENGINSINLSAGYMNEHTDREFAVLSDMKDTVRLILQAFAVINNFYHSFGDVPKENRWIEAYDYAYGYGASSDYNKYYEEANSAFGSFTYAEEFDKNGDVYVYEMGREIAITQGDNEILLTRESLKSLIEQLKTQI